MPVYREKKEKWTKDGKSYAFRCYYTDMYGNRKQKESKLYKLKSEAKEAERKFLEEVAKKDAIENNVEFKTAYNNWLEHKKDTIKITTYYDLKKRLDKHIFSYFKDYKIHKIKINNLNDWKNNLMKKNLSVKSTNMMISYFKEMLKFFNIYYEFDNKVANYLTNIRNDKPTTVSSNSETNFWTISEFNSFIKVVDNEFYKVIFIFLYRTGLRIGELMALTWKDIDLLKKKVTINKSMSHNTFEDGYIIVRPKTNNSVRIVDLDDFLVKLLKSYKSSERNTYMFDESWFVFGGVKNLGLTSLRRNLNKYIDIAKVKKITIHGFRHSHVSMLVYLGCDVKDVAERIGDTIQMVEKTYYHMFPEKKKDTIEKINNLKF